MTDNYDLIIIGGGPAGLTAGIYASRAKLNVLIIEKENVGALWSAHKIANFPGFPEEMSGKDLVLRFKEQAKNFGCTIVNETFLELQTEGDLKIIKTSDGSYKALSVIIATGWPKNNSNKIKGEEEFLGKGVSYCATCDGAFTRGMIVSLFGNGEEVAEEALFLTNHAKEVLVFSEESELNCSEESKNALLARENVNIIGNTKIKEIKGSDYVEKIDIIQDGEEKTINSDYAFLYLGTKSTKDLFSILGSLDKDGYFISDNLETNIEGIYIAGDFRSGSIRQVTVASADGTKSALKAIKYVLTNKKKN